VKYQGHLEELQCLTFAETSATLLSLGGEAASEQHDKFSWCLVELLGAEPASIDDMTVYRAALKHGFSYYYWKWDPRAKIIYEPLKRAVDQWSRQQPIDIDLLCELTDFLFFVVWCFDESSTEQCRKLVEPLRAASAAFARTVGRRQFELPAAAAPRIVWLAMYAESKNAMSGALCHVAPVLRSAGWQLDIYSWRFGDVAFQKFAEQTGATFYDLRRDSPTETINAVEDRAAQDNPTIVVSDMNTAVPTALFSRRLAPVQIFLQAGMPAWPVQHLDAVLNSFGFDSAVAGWDRARMLAFNPPWDLAALDPPVTPHEIADERATMPQGLRLIGSYGRLSKVTEPYLKAAEQVLLCCQDVAFVLGGTGDASAIKAFISTSPVGNRMHVEARFVPGHVWGHILEVMADTWPVTGGESCRETIAKGKPVVTMHSHEMPALDLQRDTMLVKHEWDEYAEQIAQLLQNPAAYLAACHRARTLSSKMSDDRVFGSTLIADFAATIESVRNRACAEE
jgi:hypothetical protein